MTGIVRALAALTVLLGTTAIVCFIAGVWTHGDLPARWGGTGFILLLLTLLAGAATTTAAY